MAVITLGELEIEVIQKPIKNIHLSVHPPAGRVRIAAPEHYSLDTLRIYALSKLPWIRKQQARMVSQEREPERQYLDRESHYYLGKRYLLRVEETVGRPSVSVRGKSIYMSVRPDADTATRRRLLKTWYRQQLREIAVGLVAKWEPLMDVRIAEMGIKTMKTRWGTCNPESRRIWLNLQLAKKPLLCIEYLVVHEMVHLLERTHNKRFQALMDYYLPAWPQLRVELNKLPVSHVEWNY